MQILLKTTIDDKLKLLAATLLNRLFVDENILKVHNDSTIVVMNFVFKMPQLTIQLFIEFYDQLFYLIF